MSKLATRFHGPISARDSISLGDHTTICNQADGDLILKVKDRQLSVLDLINRLEALEQAYMELILLGKAEGPGKIET